MKIKLSMLAVMGSALTVLPAAAIELGRGPGTVYGDPVLGSGINMSITNVSSAETGFYRIIAE